MFDPIRNHPLLTWIDLFLFEHPGANLYLVGGAVRDALRGWESTDFDFVTSGVEPIALEVWLQAHGTVSFVGKRFGVWKFSPHHDPANPTIDIALPRRDVSIGSEGGYRQFLVESDPNLPIENDLARRDFTVNAIAYDWRSDNLIDPFEGRSDLNVQLIRTVGNPAERFREDSSRLLRALRFACTLGFSIEDKTWSVLKQMTPRLRLEVHGQRVVARELMAEEFIKALEADAARCVELYHASGAWNELFISPLNRTTPDSSITAPPPAPPWQGGVGAHSKFAMPLLGKEGLGVVSRELVLVLLCDAVFEGVSEAYDWLHLWRFEMQTDVKAVVMIVRALKTNPENVSLAQIERQLIPYRELFSEALIATEHRDAKIWLERLLLVYKRHELPPLLSLPDLKDIPDGPKRGEIVQAIRSAQLAGEISTRDEALRILSQLRR